MRSATTTWIAICVLAACSKDRNGPDPDAGPGDAQGPDGGGDGSGDGAAGGAGDGDNPDGREGEGEGEDPGPDGAEGEPAEGPGEGEGEGEGEEGEGPGGGPDDGGEGEGEGADLGEGEGEGDLDGPGDACLGEADRAALAQADVGRELLICTLQCLGQPAGCAAGCLAAATGLSAGCAACFPPSEACRTEHCVNDCVPDRSAVPCKDCWDRQCGEGFLRCSGLAQPPEPARGPNLAAACLNPEDRAVLGADPPPALRRAASSCAFECLGAPAEDCAPACVAAATGISALCAECFVAAGSCPLRECLQECLPDSAAPPCTACLADRCDPEFQVCSGLEERPEDPPAPPPPPAPEDACLGEDDTAALDGDGRADMRTIARDCAFQCLGRPAGCAGACIGEGAGLSADCATCFALEQACVAGSCFLPCLAGRGDPACAACVDAACKAGFEACAGRAYPAPPEGGGDPEEPDPPPPVDACLGGPDLAVARGPLDLWAQMGQCGLRCLGQGQGRGLACHAACLMAEAGLSEGCADCYGRLQRCRAEACFGPCLQEGPDGPQCGPCLLPECLPAFAACAGYGFGAPPP